MTLTDAQKRALLWLPADGSARHAITFGEASDAFEAEVEGLVEVLVEKEGDMWVSATPAGLAERFALQAAQEAAGLRERIAALEAHIKSAEAVISADCMALQQGIGRQLREHWTRVAKAKLEAHEAAYPRKAIEHE